MEGREPSCQATIRVHLWATVFNEVSIQSRPLAAFGASRAESAARPQTPDCHFRDISVAFFLSFFAVSSFAPLQAQFTPLLRVLLDAGTGYLPAASYCPLFG